MDNNTCNDGELGLVSYTDESGDVASAFVDITGADLLLTEKEVIVSIHLANIPTELEYADERIDELKYSWSATFDVNCDGLNNGNIEISVKYFGREDIDTKGSILKHTQHNVWKTESDGRSANVVGEIRVEVLNTTLRLSASRSIHPDLYIITTNTPVKFGTYSRDSKTGVHSDALSNGLDYLKRP